LVIWKEAVSRIKPVYVCVERNLITNSGFEEGESPWTFTPAFESNIGEAVISTDNPFEGTYCLEQILPKKTGGRPGCVACRQEVNFTAYPYRFVLSFRPEHENVCLYIIIAPIVYYIYFDRIVCVIYGVDYGSETVEFPISWMTNSWNTLEFQVADGKTVIYLNSAKVGELGYVGAFNEVYTQSYNYDADSTRRMWLDNINLLVSCAIYDFDEIITANGYNFYLWRSWSNNCVILLWGGPLWTSFVQTAPLYHPVQYSQVYHDFLKALRKLGYNILSPAKQYPPLGSDQTQFLTGLFSWIASQGWNPYLFGYSAGGTIAAHEIIEKTYATRYRACVIASGLMRYGQIDLVAEADQIKTNTLIIAPIDDTQTYQGLIDFYNKALAAPYDVSLVQWSNGHDPFPNLSLDGRTLTKVTTDWFSAH
jgi:hypothetical protein